MLAILSAGDGGAGCEGQTGLGQIAFNLLRHESGEKKTEIPGFLTS